MQAAPLLLVFHATCFRWHWYRKCSPVLVGLLRHTGGVCITLVCQRIIHSIEEKIRANRVCVKEEIARIRQVDSIVDILIGSSQASSSCPATTPTPTPTPPNPRPKAVGLTRAKQLMQHRGCPLRPVFRADQTTVPLLLSIFSFSSAFLSSCC